jgi:hypothetical protein
MAEDEVSGLPAIVKIANTFLAHVYARVTKAKLSPQYQSANLRAKGRLAITGKSKSFEIPIIIQLSDRGTVSIDNIAVAIRQGLVRTMPAVRLEYGVEFKKPPDDPEIIKGQDAILRAADSLLKQCDARAMRIIRNGIKIQIKISGTWQYTGKGFNTLAEMRLSAEETVTRSDLADTLTSALKRDGVKVRLTPQYRARRL